MMHTPARVIWCRSSAANSAPPLARQLHRNDLDRVQGSSWRVHRCRAPVSFIVFPALLAWLSTPRSIEEGAAVPQGLLCELWLVFCNFWDSCSRAT